MDTVGHAWFPSEFPEAAAAALSIGNAPGAAGAVAGTTVATSAESGATAAAAGSATSPAAAGGAAAWPPSLRLPPPAFTTAADVRMHTESVPLHIATLTAAGAGAALLHNSGAHSHQMHCFSPGMLLESSGAIHYDGC